MMDFVMMTISFTVAILLASGVTTLVLLNKPVMKMYLKHVSKITEEVMDESMDDYLKDL